ncbi:MAG: SRPBCC family protein [Gammaproteobacteria bacterium]
MTTVSMKTDLNVPADQVWEIVGRFNALPDWHPAVEKSELEDGGKLRRLSLVGGGSIVERLEQLDEEEQLYRYSIIESPLPVANYSATLRVKPSKDGKGCSVEWSSDFNPAGASLEEATKAIQGVYQAGLDNLSKLFDVGR